MKNKKKFLVIGNPIKHSLSPSFINIGFENIKLILMYKKLKINQAGIKKILNKIRKKRIRWN